MQEPIKPLAQVGEFAELRVASLEPIGAFLDWGMPKELFLPFSETTRRLEEGERIVVYIYVDNQQRSCASMRVERFVRKTPGNLRDGDSVELFIVSETDLGFKAVVDGKYLGVLYRNEVFKPIRVGQKLPGFISKIREDGKIDLVLQRSGYQASTEIGEAILALLESRGGFLPIGDKSSAEVIYDIFGVSKKKFKMAVGGLYKKRLIQIQEDGIRLKP